MSETLDREVLAKIGTNALLSSGYSDFCIRQWRRRGVPWKERPRVQRLAAERGIEVPEDFLETQRPTPEKQKRSRSKAKRRTAREAA